MAKSIRLSDDLLVSIEHTASSTGRSPSEQLKYWVAIGRTAEDNPDLPFSFIKDAIAAGQELQAGKVKRYTRRTPK
ncbi:TA system antitoxin ParD family protein [Oceanimonas smirnovii]|uniref:TA system antitoxin ParD family protein n=1 Tax=Oceanimonas smirnovii TaxID=264574 RepID=UPI003FCF6478